jgi:uncharacterized protein YndB with AHSA1/START domain
MDGWVLTVERLVPAPANAIFDVLADPSKHNLIDGSGMLQGAKQESEPRLTLGSTFGMGMRMFVSYSTVNRVVEFEENRRIAWKTGPAGAVGRVLAGRIWRYELEPTGGGTRVRESWDITEDHQRVLLKLGSIYSKKTKKDMERTLERLSELVSADSPGAGSAG